MEVNNYLPGRLRVLSSESGVREPDIITNILSSDLYSTSLRSFSLAFTAKSLIAFLSINIHSNYIKISSSLLSSSLMVDEIVLIKANAEKSEKRFIDKFTIEENARREKEAQKSVKVEQNGEGIDTSNSVEITHSQKPVKVIQNVYMKDLVKKRQRIKSEQDIDNFVLSLKKELLSRTSLFRISSSNSRLDKSSKTRCFASAISSDALTDLDSMKVRYSSSNLLFNSLNFGILRYGVSSPIIFFMFFPRYAK